jgi:hypothetical protein
MGQDRSLDAEGIPDLEGPLPEKSATGDPQEGVAPPADHPASLDWGTTAEEQRLGEPLDRQLARELPDVTDDRDTVGHELFGRPEDNQDGLSAEESAMHVEREP